MAQFIRGKNLLRWVGQKNTGTRAKSWDTDSKLVQGRNCEGCDKPKESRGAADTLAILSGEGKWRAQ